MVGVASCLEQLAAVDAEQRKSGKINDFGVGELAPQFKASFAALSVLMTSKGSKPTKEENNEAVVEEPTTPDQPTIPVNPKFSSSTGESQGEPSTKKLLDDFLFETMYALKGDFSYPNWLPSRIQLHLFHRYI